MRVPRIEHQSSQNKRSVKLVRAVSTIVIVILAALMEPDVAGAQTVTIIRSFGTHGSIIYPQGAPVQGRDGELYAETTFATPTVFKEQTSGNAVLLYKFDILATPSYPVLLGHDGNWYGTTEGPGQFPEGGLLYRITPSGVFTILHSFSTTTNGAAPVGSVIEINGKLYGTTGGNTVGATVYTYDLSTGTFSTLYQFDSSQLLFLGSALLRASDGNLYGLGSRSDNCGAAFKMTPSGTLLNIYYFDCSLQVGISETNAPLIEAADGNFYSTTAQGGPELFGMVFKMDRSGHVTVLHSFGSDNDGINPGPGLVAATDGNLYGTTSRGQGNAEFGTIYQISISGTYQQLYLWSATDRLPWGLLQDTDGKFYGYLAFGKGPGSAGAFYSLDMGLAPFITFGSSTGAVGQTVQILGQRLTGSTGVTFNGVPATKFAVVKDTFMTAVIPSGATTGPVVVTTPTGTLTSNKTFSVVP